MLILTLLFDIIIIIKVNGPTVNCNFQILEIHFSSQFICYIELLFHIYF
jgi:hypothetical protein